MATPEGSRAAGGRGPATESPLVSCIVPVFNGERFLAAALDSIFAQTWRPLDVIVVDDGSTDGSVRVAARYGERITHIQQANAGPAAARNRGLGAAAGAFVAFLDQDDLWHEEKLARQMARFEARPELELCFASIRTFWEPEVKAEEERLREPLRAGGKAGYLTQTMLARRALFERVGPFDVQARHRDATDWILRATDCGAVIDLLPEVLAYRRIHRDNFSRQRTAADHEYLLRVVKGSLDRRRRDAARKGSSAAPARGRTRRR